MVGLRVRALLLIGSLLSATSAVSVAAAPPEPVAFVVGVRDLPEDHAPFHGEPVASSDADLRYVLVNARNPTAFEARARGDPNVRYVEEDRLDVHALLTPNDAHYAVHQYDMKAGTTNISSAWDTTLGTSSAKVCVTDTGLYREHEDFADLTLLGFADFTGTRRKQPGPFDDNGHGTHVTGTIAAATDNGKGVAGIAQASILSAKVLNRQGSGTFTMVANGFKWCADQGAHILGASLGASSGSSVIQDAVAYAQARGVLIIAAAGNSGPCENCVGYPAAYAGVLAISCTDAANALCSFSSTGPQVALAAPGKSILSTWPKGIAPCPKSSGNSCYVFASGTSMSTPHVAGLAALVKSAHGTHDAAAIEAALRGSARDLGPSGNDPSFGSGLIQGTAV